MMLMMMIIIIIGTSSTAQGVAEVSKIGNL